MALFDSIISEVSSRSELGDKAAPLVSALYALIQGEGLSSFLDRFNKVGLGNLVSSWISDGANEPLTESQLGQVLGGDLIRSLASKAGTSEETAKPVLAFVLPAIIDKLTPSGVIPSSLPSVGSQLSGVPGTSAAAASTGNVVTSSAISAASDAAMDGSGLLKLLPLLLLVLATWAGYRYCNRPMATQQVAAVPTPTPVVKINSSLSMIYGEDGKVKITGVVPDQATKDRILAEAKAVYGEGKFEADIRVDSHAQPAGWFAKLADIFRNFNIPGAELSFDGEALKVAGVSAAIALIDKFKGLFPSFNITSAFLNVEDAAKEANAKAMAALASLTGSSSAEDVVKALNLQIINFASGKADLPQANQEILKKAAETIKGMAAGTKIEVGGHTDNKGAADGNLKLSQARADAVQKFLIASGVRAESLTAKGYGPDKPVATNDTEEGRFKNRRIEFALAK